MYSIWLPICGFFLALVDIYILSWIVPTVPTYGLVVSCILMTLINSYILHFYALLWHYEGGENV